MLHVPPRGATVPGYDVSHYQPISIHSIMQARGEKFCFIKATEGTGIVDSLFAAHWAEAIRCGMIVSPYGFFHPSQDPIAQAVLMERVIGKLGPGTLGPVIDWEVTDGVAPARDSAVGRQFIKAVQDETHKMGIEYGGAYFYEALDLPSPDGMGFWAAEYGPALSTGPLVPSPWTTWDFWQFTDGGSTDLDLNVFNGTLEELQKKAA